MNKFSIGVLKGFKVRDKKTGEMFHALPNQHNRLGNLCTWVDGKFYNNRDFAKKFEIVKSIEQ